MTTDDSTHQQLTAYALGECDPAEAAAIATRLANDPEARAWVAGVRATAHLLHDQLAAELAGDGGPGASSALNAGSASASALDAGRTAAILRQARARTRPNRRLRHLAIGGSLLAAGVAVAVMQTSDASAQPRTLVASAPTLTDQSRDAPAPMITKDIAAESWQSMDLAAGGDGNVSASPITAMDSPDAMTQSEPEVSAPLAIRPEAAADSELGSSGAFMAVGAMGCTGGRREPVHPSSVPLPSSSSAEHRALLMAMSHAALYDTARQSATSMMPVPSDGERYRTLPENGFLAPADHPLSTFGVDVDTASYAHVRRFIEQGQLPPADAVRLEELVNYFPYHDAPPAADSDRPFAVRVEVAACPWNSAHRLARIGIKGREIDHAKRPAANLVFLIDVSGSMDEPRRLPLVKSSLKQLVDRLRGDDRVAIVTYAGESTVALDSTPCRHRDRIHAAIDRLRSGGGTNGASGIDLAYRIAHEHRAGTAAGASRVILCTDGDFNVGVADPAGLGDLIQEKHAGGVFLTCLGFGMGDYRDITMQTLANRGNGTYAYIDNEDEGRRALVDQLAGTLVTIAKDVKIQVEFNPARVGAYRLLGYEKRVLAPRDFNDDTKDAGEIGAGHTVTALYELVPVGGSVPETDALRYHHAASPRSWIRWIDTDPSGAAASATSVPQGPPSRTPWIDPDAIPREAAWAAELMYVKLRYQQPGNDASRLLRFPVADRADEATPSGDFRFAAAVAACAMILRDSPHRGSANWSTVLELAMAGVDDRSGRRQEFVDLVRAARRVGRDR